MHIDLEQVQQEDTLWPWLNDTSDQFMQQLDENYNADLLDAWADLAYQQEQAMKEEMQSPTQPVYNTVSNNGDLKSCIGIWPGDETDSELLQSLKQTRDLTYESNTN
jgi:hypothetical protein